MTDSPRAFDDDAVEALLSGQGDGLSGQGDGPLAALLTDLRGVADRPAPVPSAALAELLRTGLPVDELARRRGRRTLIAGAAAAGVAATLALSGVAAANDALPGPAEHVITDIINNLTPFDLTPQPATSAPTEVHRPGHGRSGEPEPGDDRSGHDSGSGSGSDDGSGSGSGSGSSGGGSDDGSGSGSGSGGTSGSGSSGGGSDDSSGSGSGDTSGSGSPGGSGDSGTSGGTSGSGSGGSDDGSGHTGRG